MTESPFVTIHNIVCEPANAVAELRIIARDEHRLADRDREAIVRGADELELAQRAAALTYAQLLEARQHLAAATDRLNALQARAPLIMTLGPVALTVQSNGWRP